MGGCCLRLLCHSEGGMVRRLGMIRTKGWTVVLAALCLLTGTNALAQEGEKKAGSEPVKAKDKSAQADKSAVATAVDKVVADEKSGEKFPVSASASLGYSFNQAQFVDCAGQDCGWQRIGVGMGVSYSPIKSSPCLQA